MKDLLTNHILIRKLTIFLFEIMWVNHRVIKGITRLDVLKTIVERWLTMESCRFPMRTMEPREKGRFEKHMKVAYFLLGSGTVGGDQRDWVGPKTVSLTQRKSDGWN
jgi:hypothetical protein